MKSIELRRATAADMQLVYDVTEATMRGYVEKAFGPWDPIVQKEVIDKSFDPTKIRVHRHQQHT